MTPSEWERQALVFNIQVTAVPEEGPVHSMSDIVAALNEVYERGDAIQFLHDRDEDNQEDEDKHAQPEDEEVTHVRGARFIGCIQEHEDGCITILIKAGDPEGTNPAFIHNTTGRTRIVARGEEESNGYAAHLVIGPERADRDHVGAYRCVLERMPHLGRTVVINFLNRLIRSYYKNERDLQFEHPETRKMRKYYPKLDTYTQLSHSLRDDITEGKLSHIEFISRHAEIQADEETQVEVDRRILRLKPKSTPINRDRAISLINSIKDIGRRSGYEEMQLFFKKLDSQPSFSPRFTTELEDAAEALYSRMEPLTDFSEPLLQCPERIHRELEEKLLGLVRDPELWR